MRKLVLLIVLAIIVWSSHGQEITTLRIGDMDITGLKTGKIIDIPVYLDEIEQAISLFQMYINYDQTVLEYQSTININPAFKDGWKDNLTKSFYAVVYIDVKRDGILSEQKGKLCDLQFKYLGGETNILFGKDDKIEDGIRIMGETKLIANDKSELQVQFFDGCVCSKQ